MSNQVYSTGRRKESIAKVWVSNGTGNITINKKNIEDYLLGKPYETVFTRVADFQSVATSQKK